MLDYPLLLLCYLLEQGELVVVVVDIVMDRFHRIDQRFQVGVIGEQLQERISAGRPSDNRQGLLLHQSGGDRVPPRECEPALHLQPVALQQKAGARALLKEWQKEPLKPKEARYKLHLSLACPDEDISLSQGRQVSPPKRYRSLLALKGANVRLYATNPFLAP